MLRADRMVATWLSICMGISRSHMERTRPLISTGSRRGAASIVSMLRLNSAIAERV